MSDLKAQIREAGGELRKAQNMMFSGKKDEAAAMVLKIMVVAEKLLQEMPNDFQVKQLNNNTNKLKKDLERRGYSFGTPPPEEPTAAPATPQKPQLPSLVKTRLEFIKSSYKRKDSKTALKYWNEIQSDFKGQFDEEAPEIVEAGKMVGELIIFEQEKFAAEEKERQEKEAQEKQAAARREQSEKWLDKFREIKQIGYTTGSPEGLLQQQKEYNDAFAFFKEYKAVDFPNGKDEYLIEKEAVLEKQIGEFPTFYIETANTLANDVSERIKQRYDSLLNNTEWKDDPKLKPITVSNDELLSFEKQTAEVLKLFKESTNSSQNMEQTLALLKQENAMRKQTMIDKTTFEPACEVEGGEAIIEKARKIVQEKREVSEILQSRVISKWKEESAWKATDTLGSSSKFVTTKSLSVQVAATEKSGKTILHTLHIESQLMVDKTWGDIYGHIMWSDEMVADNAFV